MNRVDRMFDKLFRFGPDWFGGYRRIRKIGTGGMAVLYEGEDPATGKTVVIKVLEPSAVPLREDTLWEGEIAKGLRHPNLVQTYECGKKGGKHFIVMEMLNGPSLKTKSTARDRWLNGRRLKVLTGIAEGLAFMHRRRLVHRDFNSRNVMFRDVAPVIIDFGLTVSAFDRVKPSADRRGTPSYMAPELVLKNQVDQRTDIYALGVVMYEVATGRLPFAGENIYDRMQKSVSMKARPPSEIVPNVTRSADALIFRCMIKNPEQRFQTMDDILEHLSYMKESDFGGVSEKKDAISG